GILRPRRGKEQRLIAMLSAREEGRALVLLAIEIPKRGRDAARQRVAAKDRHAGRLVGFVSRPRDEIRSPTLYSDLRHHDAGRSHLTLLHNVEDTQFDAVGKLAAHRDHVRPAPTSVSDEFFFRFKNSCHFHFSLDISHTARRKRERSSPVQPG